MNMNRLILTLLCGALLAGGTACSGDDPQPSDKPQPENPGGTDTPDTPGLPTYPKPDRSQIAAFPGRAATSRAGRKGRSTSSPRSRTTTPWGRSATPSHRADRAPSSLP